MTEQPAEEIVVEEPAEAAPPPPLEAPPVVESLAEQVARERTAVVESVGPSDVVPNRPQIRDPASYQPVEEAAAEEEILEPPADPLSAALSDAPAHQSAADLIAAAEAAQTTDELDAIEAQAEGRVTVLDAVAARRQELSA